MYGCTERCMVSHSVINQSSITTASLAWLETPFATGAASGACGACGACSNANLVFFAAGSSPSSSRGRLFFAGWISSGMMRSSSSSTLSGCFELEVPFV